MFEPSKILNIARREVGVKEEPPNSNSVKYNRDYYGNDTRAAWCCVFVWWVFNAAGMSEYFYGGGKTASCQTLMDYTKSKKQFIKSGYQPGDILFMNFNGGTRANHVGIVVSANESSVETIEGNTGSNNDANGGQVLTRTRSSKNILGAARVSGDIKSTEEEIETLANQDIPQEYTVGGTGSIETVASISSQPLMPFVRFYVGGQELTIIPPNSLMSFEFRKSANDQSHQFTITLFDDDWDTIESICTNYPEDVELLYGYVNGKQSPVYKCRLLKYSLDFNSTGTIIHIDGMTTGALSNLMNITLNTNTKNPTEAAKAVARAAGWIVRDENFRSSKDVELGNLDSFSLINKRPATYIIDTLCKLAERDDGESGYRFYLDDSEKPPIAYFGPVEINPRTERTYIYMKGIDSPVIDLQLNINGVFGGSTLGIVDDGTAPISTGFTTRVIDPLSKEQNIIHEDLNTVKTKVTGKYSHTKSDQYIASVDSSGLSASEIKTALRYHLKHSNKAVQYEGVMTLIGDPELKLLEMGNETIRLLIVTDRGDLHHSSGLYFVLGIIDNITNGIMTTTLEIKKSEDIQAGIELVQYKKLYQ